MKNGRFKKNIFPYLGIASFFIVFIFFSFFLVSRHYSLAAVVSFIQSDWAGGSSAGNASQNNWKYYFSKDASMQTLASSTAAPIIQWSFENDANDAFGNRNGTASGSPAYASGLHGQALTLDGDDDFISVPNATALDLTNNFTISAWVKKTEDNRYQTILDKGNYTLGLASNGRPYFSVSSDDGTIASLGQIAAGSPGVFSMVVHNGELYGAGNNKIYKYLDNGSWSLLKTIDYASVFNTVYTMASYNGRLFVFSRGDNKIYVYDDVVNSWQKLTNLYDTQSDKFLSAAAVFNNELYVATIYGLYKYKGGDSWMKLCTNPSGSWLTSMIVYKGKIYIGGDYGKIWRYDAGVGLVQVGDTPDDVWFGWAMAEYNGSMYAGFYTSSTIYRYDGGSTWTDVGALSNTTQIFSLISYSGKLYAAGASSGYLYRYDGGTTWTRIVAMPTQVASVYRGKIFGGTYNGAIYSYGQGQIATSSQEIGDGWNNITASYGSSILKLYVNGVLTSTSSVSFNLATSSNNLLIGKSYGSREGVSGSSGEENFRGQIDEVKIYNSVLTAAEISAAYQQGKYDFSKLVLNTSSSSAADTSDTDFGSGTLSNSNIFDTGSNSSVRLAYSTGGTSTSAYDFPASSTVIYRSNGPSRTNELASGTGSFLFSVDASGNAIFSGGSLPDNSGAGDAIVYDSNNDNVLNSLDDIVFIHGRTSNTAYTVKNQSGANTATTTDSNDTWAVYRAYTSLANAEAGTKNASLSSIGIPYDLWTNGKNISANATGTREVWNIACYADAADGPVVLSGWTTGDDNYLRIFTPYLTSDVGVSQRHNGKWDSSKYNSLISANTAIMIYIGNARIEGLQINHINAQGWGDKAVWLSDTGTANNNVYISSNIIKGDSSRYDWVNGIAIYADGGGRTFIYNNIIYNFTSSSLGGNIYFEAAGYVSYLYNNTVSNARNCYTRISGTIYAFNNVARSCIDGFNGSFAGTSNYNISDISGDAPNNGFGGGYAAVSFISIATSSKDMRLKNNDTAAQDKGANFSADPNLSFTTDINNQLRPNGASWDIGADEYSGYPATGTIVSRIFDMKNKDFSTVFWNSSLPSASTTVYIKARTSNDASMTGAANWLDCNEIRSNKDISNSSCVADGERYLQYQATLATGDQSFTPYFQDITFNYNTYSTAASLISSPYDSGNTTNFLSSLSWREATTTPANTSVGIYLKSAPDQASLSSSIWQFIATSSSGGLTANCVKTNDAVSCNPLAIPSTFKDYTDDRWLQYGIAMKGDSTLTPSLYNISLDNSAAVSPTISTAAISSITQTSANADSSITNQGNASSTERGFVWATTTIPTTSSYFGKYSETGVYGLGSFLTSISALACSQNYHVRSYAINPGGTGYGSSTSFSTAPCDCSVISHATGYNIYPDCSPTGCDRGYYLYKRQCLIERRAPTIIPSSNSNSSQEKIATSTLNSNAGISSSTKNSLTNNYNSGFDRSATTSQIATSTPTSTELIIPETVNPVKNLIDLALSKKLSGKFLLAVEQNGRLWYVNPADLNRYLAGNPNEIFRIMGKLSLGVLHKIAKKQKVPKNLWGLIILDTEDLGKAYYIDPANGKKHYLGRPAEAFKIIAALALGISNKNLEKIEKK